MTAGEVKDIVFTGADVSKLSVAVSTAALIYASVGPAGLTVSTTSKWLSVRDQGTDYYIPMWK